MKDDRQRGDPERIGCSNRPMRIEAAFDAHRGSAKAASHRAKKAAR